MFTVKETIEVSAAHKLEGYDGKCANLHGHNYIIEVELSVADSELNPLGMVLDFSTIKSLVMQFDHCYINEHPLWKEYAALTFNQANDTAYQPTAECLAHCIGLVLKEAINPLFPRATNLAITVRVREDRDSYGQWSYVNAR